MKNSHRGCRKQCWRAGTWPPGGCVGVRFCWRVSWCLNDGKKKKEGLSVRSLRTWTVSSDKLLTSALWRENGNTGACGVRRADKTFIFKPPFCQRVIRNLVLQNISTPRGDQQNSSSNQTTSWIIRRKKKKKKKRRPIIICEKSDFWTVIAAPTYKVHV